MVREVGVFVSVKESNGHLKSESFLATIQNPVAKFHARMYLFLIGYY